MNILIQKAFQSLFYMPLLVCLFFSRGIQAMEGQNQEELSPLFGHLDFELLPIIFNHLPGNSPILNYFVNDTRFYNRQTVEKIENAFFVHLTNKAKSLNQHFDSNVLKLIVEHCMIFPQHPIDPCSKKRLSPLFDDVRALHKSIPNNPQRHTPYSCCSLSSLDTLNSKKITRNINNFCRNTIPQWESLHENTRRTISISEFMDIKAKILHHFQLRITEYSTKKNVDNRIIAGGTVSTFGIVTGIAGVGMQISSVALLGLSCAGIGLIPLILLSKSENDDEECEHQLKIKTLQNQIKLPIKTFQYKIAMLHDKVD